MTLPINEVPVLNEQASLKGCSLPEVGHSEDNQFLDICSVMNKLPRATSINDMTFSRIALPSLQTALRSPIFTAISRLLMWLRPKSATS